MIVCTARSRSVTLALARWTVSPWWKATEPFGTSTKTGSIAGDLGVGEDVLRARRRRC